MLKTVLDYRSERLRVVGRLEFDSPFVVVTFSSYTDHPDLDRPGFGEDFLARHGLDAVHVICRDNNWYQYPEMPAVLSRIRPGLPPGATIITYGSSMGGYAALTFAHALGAARVVALSPQYSVDPRRMPGDRRWIGDARRIDYIHDIQPAPDPACQVFIVFDPHDVDRLHVRRLRRHMRLHEIAVPFAGHPVSGALAEAGLLSSLILGLLQGRHDAVAFARSLARARLKTPTLLQNLHDVVPPWRPRLRARLLGRIEALAAARLAIDANDIDAGLILGGALAQQRRFADAIDTLRRYVPRSDHVWAGLALGRLLVASGASDNAAEAEAIFRPILARASNLRHARLCLALALVRQGKRRAARAEIGLLLRQAPGNLFILGLWLRLTCGLRPTPAHYRRAVIPPHRRSAARWFRRLWNHAEFRQTHGGVSPAGP